MTTVLAAGPNGPQLNELTGTFAGQEIIDRTLVNAWQDSRVHEAVTQAGRTKILIAGTGLDVCAQLPALACTAEGYDAYVILDACGRLRPGRSPDAHERTGGCSDALGRLSRSRNQGAEATLAMISVLQQSHRLAATEAC